MNNLLKRIVITNWIPIKREQPLHTYLNNNNRRKQNMAQREQLTLCSSQVNKHKWKHNIKNLFARELTLKKLILEETRDPDLFKINVYTSK
jgi:hypothetical protein